MLYKWWPEFVGGPLDGQPIEEAEILRAPKVIVRDDERYVLRRHRDLGPAAIGCYLWEMWPKQEYWPYAVTRRIVNSHPQLVDVQVKEEDE